MFFSLVIILLICTCAFAFNYEKDHTADDDFVLYNKDQDINRTRYHLTICDEQDEEKDLAIFNCANFTKEDCSKF